MDHEFSGEIMEYEELASGDASSTGTNLHVLPSMVDLGDIQEELTVEDPHSELEVFTPGSPSGNIKTLPQEWSGLITLKRDSSPRAFPRKSIPAKSKSVLRKGRSRSNCSLSTIYEKGTIPASVLTPLLYCGACHVVPITSLTVYKCKNGHQICGHCFGRGHKNCENCNEPFDGRNEILESVLRRLHQLHSELFPQEDVLTRMNSDLKLKLEEAESTSKNVQHSSHRPVDCPHLDCGRVVASNGFLAHFEFEHPSVPVFQMSPGYTHMFHMPARCLRIPDMTRVVSVIEVNVTNYKSEVVVKRSTQSPRAAAFPVRRDAIICVLLSSIFMVGDSSFFIVWSSCLYDDFPPLSYSLQLKTSSGGEIAYKGPMTSLHHSQDPQHILEESQCMVLAPDSFVQLCHSNNGMVPLHLKFNVINF